MYIWNHSFRRDSQNASRCAFTLIEIIVVVIIISIAALIAIPVFSGASEMQLSAAADKLAADMEYAKSLAVTTQRNHKVVFDTNADSYDIWGFDSGTSTWKIVTDPVKKSDFVVVYSQEGRLSRVGITATTFTGNTVEFNYTGAPVQGGTITLSAGGNPIIVSVESATGYISIQ
jgi:prepilin-type N-terminal cleavage/methylation domain-containing protein